METTNTIFDVALYELITPKSVLSWIRVIVANRMAVDGSSWSQIFAKFNSGTYNNQWIVVDYKKFTPGNQKLAPNTLWIIEQIPDYVESADVTDVLNNQGYWPSYNVPYFNNTYILSGNRMMYEIFGDYFSYENSPRAQIFQRDARKVNTLDDMKMMISYNDWQHDPLSGESAANAIASRWDLINHTSIDTPFLDKSAFGSTDGKATSAASIQSFQAVAISGPTHVQQKVFEWTDEWNYVTHVGLPDSYDFDWQLFQSDPK